MVTWIEISRSALLHNIQQLVSLSPSSQLGIVVKANAYGHGITTIGKLLEPEPSVSWLCTAGIEEALILRSVGSTKKILAMAYIEDAPLEKAIEKNIDIVVDDWATVYALEEYARKSATVAYVHLKIDTGLGRRGILPIQLVDLCSAFKNLKHVVLRGVCTHIADNVGKDEQGTCQQLRFLYNALEQMKNQSLLVEYVHVLAHQHKQQLLMHQEQVFYNVYS